jgi:hypothetical protein
VPSNASAGARTVFDPALKVPMQAMARQDLLFESWPSASAGRARSDGGSIVGRRHYETEPQDTPNEAVAVIDRVFAVLGSGV